jgi:Family of unknown function (DUF6134)
MKYFTLKKLFIFLLFLPNLSFAKDWIFDVLMDGKLIGEHTFQLKEEGKFSQLASHAQFKVTLLSIPVYKYKHISQEIWNKDCLYAIESSTQDGGEEYKVLGKTEANAFKLIEPTKETFVADCPMTFSYWNPIMLKQKKLLNVQTGEYTEVLIKYLGKKSVKVKNETIDADSYQILGPKINIQLWYKENTDWVKLESITPDNHHILYMLK